MKTRATNFFVGFTLCLLSAVTVTGLNRAALEHQQTGAPGRVFDIEQQQEGVTVTFFDSSWTADRGMLEQLGEMGKGLGQGVWMLRSPGVEALRGFAALGLQQLPEEVLELFRVPERLGEVQPEEEGAPSGTQE